MHEPLRRQEALAPRDRPDAPRIVDRLLSPLALPQPPLALAKGVDTHGRELKLTLESSKGIPGGHQALLLALPLTHASPTDEGIRGDLLETALRLRREALEVELEV